MKLIIVIPARIKSKRFHGKPLKKILGIPMVIRVAQICEKVTNKKNIYIATDSKKISSLIKKNRFSAIITSKKSLTGTDRVAEVSSKIKADIYINVQGDEPLVSPQDIKKIIEAKIKNKNKIICGYSEISKDIKAKSNSIPKVVMNEKNELIYISRSLIPGSKKKLTKYNKQVCIYAFNKEELNLFRNFKRKSKIEYLEDIEILRFYELNKKILMVKTSGDSIAVDYPSDIKKVERKLLENDKKIRNKSD
jgi:3-deoxy-manno-octulosonate cytidylyltransferase (CMP-KDO synthetase)